LMADSSELGGKFSPDRPVSRVPHFRGVPVENDRGRTPKHGSELFRILDP
jgi:hypothetical protein